nr:MAG TPA: hypothetical protein [Microviridae sp.]
MPHAFARVKRGGAELTPLFDFWLIFIRLL